MLDGFEKELIAALALVLMVWLGASLEPTDYRRAVSLETGVQMRPSQSRSFWPRFQRPSTTPC